MVERDNRTNDGDGAGRQTVVSIDAMGGDAGPAAVVAGIAAAMRDRPGLHVLLHGREAELSPLLARTPALAGRVTLCDAPGIVTMSDKPAHVMRHGRETSMWRTIDAVREGRATAAVSCGNTGALMGIAMLRLRRLEGINRPAIASLWPSRNPGGFNVMLDMGADVRADPEDLVQYAVMGAAYAHTGLGIARPRVGLLNVGTEENKGRSELREAGELLTARAATGGFDYVGFVEGLDLPSSRVDVIVTDGFTGNVALKTAEGTARLFADFLREAFGAGVLSRFAALLALNSLRRLRRRIDPRRVNGGVFLGLTGTVVKSHGGADETAIAAAIGLAYRLAAAGLSERIAARVASVRASGQDEPQRRPGADAGKESGFSG